MCYQAVNPGCFVFRCQEVELESLRPVYFPATFSTECQYFHLFQACPMLFKFLFYIQKNSVTE